MPLDPRELDVLRMLRRSAEPLSGRQIAGIAGAAPNTANRVLKTLQGRGLVQSTREGRASLWTTTADLAELTELEGAPQERVALVVTAVELEHTEVRNRLLNARRIRTGDIWMVRGEIPGEHVDWTVYLARAGMGNATSAALVGLAARDLRANVVAFVGTAAGLKPADHAHCDVVIASMIHNPYAGKQVSSESGSQLLGRGKTYPVPAPLLAVVNACIADSSWTASVQSQFYDEGHPCAYVAPIVSVEAVQTDPDGPVMREIRERFQDAAALDMESFGLAAGADIHDLPVLAVRGLSDFVGDKAEAGNDDLQPVAARHAAWLLRDILIFAHPDDFRRGGAATSPPEPAGGQQGIVTVALPTGVQIWMDRLAHRSAARAEAASEALTEMRRSGATAATWLNRALHRPPAWLREDDTGDGWALMSTLASIAGSKVVWRGFEQAAAVAKLTGDVDASAYFTLCAWLDRLANEDGDGHAKGTADPRAVAGLDDEVLTRFGSVIRFYLSIEQGGLATTMTFAEVALATLGLEDPSGVLRVPEPAVAVHELDPALRNLVASTLLRQLAQMMLAPGAADQLGVASGLATRTLRGNPVTRDLADDGLRLAQWAVTLRPEAEGTLLTQAQTMLGVLVSMSGRTSADVDDEISRTAMSVEADALHVRDVLRAWDGSSGSALAVAARARSIQGDFAGALRLLLPAPDGLASQQEARDPEVVRLGAFIARVTGNDDLALELAAKNTDPAEGALMRAAVLAGRPQMAREAKEALFAALDLSAGRNGSDFQALMALCRRFHALDDDEQATVLGHVNDIEQRDRDLADVLRARVALAKGDPETALRYVRGLVRSELVLEAHTDALVASGRAEEAARLVLEEGLSRGDVPLATEALVIAMDNGLSVTAREIALRLMARDDGKPVRLKALRALQRLARADGNWQEVAHRTGQIMQEAADSGLPVAEVEHWRLAEAWFFQGKFDKALTTLLEAPPVSFNEREKAQLFISVVHHAIDEQRARADVRNVVDLGDPKLYSMFMRAAADWVDDEQIAAAAMSVVLMAPGASFTEVQIADFRRYAEDYFERHGDNASITQIELQDDNLDALFDYLRSGDARQQKLEELSREVRAGRFPLAVLTEVAGRSCTESLIRRDLGFVLAVEHDGGAGADAARAALGDRAVIDTTALVVAPWTGQPFRKLAAHLDAVIVPAPVREDVARARSSLAMKSTKTLGWDTSQQRPVMHEMSPEQAQTYADEVEQVWADVQGLQVAPVAGISRKDRWLSAITLAQELGLPVWADDAAMRRFARSLGVAAFGSLDLVHAIEEPKATAAAIASLRDNRVVDLAIDEPWHRLAARADWQTGSPFAVALSRPAAWRNIPEAFAEFRTLIQLRPDDMDPEQTAAWAHLAANGLAEAIDPGVRPTVVSALLAWVIFFADPFFMGARKGAVAGDGEGLPVEAGRVTGFLLSAAEDLRDRHYPGADVMGPVVDILCHSLLDSIGPEATSRTVAALVGRLSDGMGARLFAAYLLSVAK